MGIIKAEHIAVFTAGMLFSTKGFELLKTSRAHELLVKGTALALRGRDELMENVTSLREACDDIYAEAVQYNENLPDAVTTEVEVIEDKSRQAEKNS